MTDLEILKSLYERNDIEYNEWWGDGKYTPVKENECVVETEEGMRNVNGYMLFKSYHIFNKDGKLLRVENYE